MRVLKNLIHVHRVREIDGNQRNPQPNQSVKLTNKLFKL